MRPDQGRKEQKRVCPVCETQLPDDPSVRRCPRCGARALEWASDPQPQLGVVLFNARLAGIMAGGFVAMTGLLVLGYRFPLPWHVALAAISLPVLGYIAFGTAAQKVPRSWRTPYLVTALAADAGLLSATIVAVIGLLKPLPLLGIAAGVAAAVWPLIHRALAREARKARE